VIPRLSAAKPFNRFRRHLSRAHRNHFCLRRICGHAGWSGVCTSAGGQRLRKPPGHHYLLRGHRRIGRGGVEICQQPARADQMERARGLDGRRSSLRFRGLPDKLPGLAQGTAHGRTRRALHRAIERLPQSRDAAAARYENCTRLLRAELSTRAHRASGRGPGTSDRLFRTDRHGLALSESGISRPALPPATRSGRGRLQARLGGISEQGWAHRPPQRE